jgi:hypothetical protein
MSVALTPEQAQAVAELARTTGPLVLHQLGASESDVVDLDVYATPRGTSKGFLISPNGAAAPFGETLPAHGESAST